MLLPWSLAFLLLGCINVKLVTIGQKTALERQLVGTCEGLDNELALVASVRGSGSGPAPAHSELDSKASARAARRRQLFNMDDLLELRRLGCLGEDNSGQTEPRPCDAGRADSAVAERARRIASQENEDRAAIIDLALVLDIALTPADREALQQVYARLVRREAEPGTWIQDKDGQWAR